MAAPFFFEAILWVHGHRSVSESSGSSLAGSSEWDSEHKYAEMTGIKILLEATVPIITTLMT